VESLGHQRKFGAEGFSGQQADEAGVALASASSLAFLDGTRLGGSEAREGRADDGARDPSSAGSAVRRRIAAAGRDDRARLDRRGGPEHDLIPSNERGDGGKGRASRRRETAPSARRGGKFAREGERAARVSIVRSKGETDERHRARGEERGRREGQRERQRGR